MAEHQSKKSGSVLREVDAVGELLGVARDFSPRVNFHLSPLSFLRGRIAHLAKHQQKARHSTEKGDAVAELLSVAKEFSPSQLPPH